MDTFRYIVASLLVTFVPAFLLYWLLLHSGLPLWRKLGISAAQYLLWSAVVAVAFLLVIWREPLLGSQYGFQPILAVVGAVFLAGSVVARWQIERFLPWRAQLGLPEIDPQHYGQTLVTEGPYAYTRHPRTIEVLLAWAGWALLANYLAGYFTVLLSIPLLLVIAHLEEGELRRRFHREYEIYSRRVARFWPNPRAASHQVEA
jgi:protein-S-isoprenylcysteine O-methyltransferase Ste14